MSLPIVVTHPSTLIHNGLRQLFTKSRFRPVRIATSLTEELESFLTSGESCVWLTGVDKCFSATNALVRKIVERSGLAFDAPAPFDSATSLGEALLVPTRLYVKSCLAAIRTTGAVKALAHITGGGFPDNIPRALPDHLGVQIDDLEHSSFSL